MPVADLATGNAVGNTYASGNCTWWCKQNSPWWPNGAGNAAEWFSYAQQHGFKTSQRPQTGAIAVWGPGVDPPFGYGHCANVTTVLPDGSFMVSEMNWQGLGQIDTRRIQPNDSDLQGFILPSGGSTALTAAQNAQGGILGGVQATVAQVTASAQTAAGGLLILVGLGLVVLIIARPRLPAIG